MNRRGLIAIIGVVVLALAGGGLYLYMNSGSGSSKAPQPQQVTVYTANADIPLGTTSDKLAPLVTAKQMASTAVQPGAVTDLKQVDGKQSTVTIPAGQQLLTGMFASADQAAAAGAVKLPSGTVEIAIQLNALQSVGGQLKAGGTVSVFVTATVGKSSTNTNGKEATRRVASGVMITKVVSGGTTTGTTTTSSGGTQATPQPSATATTATTTTATRPTTGSGSGMMLLLAVTPNEAAQLIMAAKSGTITLARENDSSSANAGQSATVTVDKVLG